MSRRPLCMSALVYILAIVIFLSLDTLGFAKMPLTLKESAAAKSIEDKSEVQIAGTIYKQEVKNEQLLLYLNQVTLYQNSKNIKANDIIVYTNLNTNIPIGYRILVTGKARKFQKASNLGQFNSYLYYKSLNIDFSMTADKLELLEADKNRVRDTLQQVRSLLSSNFDKITKKDTENGVFKAMVLGDASEFTGDIKDLYQKGGILHIICISGSHIEMIGIFLFHFLRKVRVNDKVAGIICIAMVMCYGIMTGFGVSAYRAVIMFAVSMIARMLGRTYDILSSLSLAAILILMDNPLYILNLGFLLSFGAVLGIAATTVIAEAFSIKRQIGRDIISCFSVSFVTLPILVYSFYEFPLYATFLNLIVIPISGLVLASGILGCLFAQISVALGSFMLGLGSYILSLYEALCKFTLELPNAILVIGKPHILQVMIYYGLFLLLLYGIKKWKKQVIWITIAMMLVITFRVPEGFWVTFLDVGQGDGIVIHTQQGTNYMIDGGSSDVKQVGNYRILPFLKAKGIRKLDYCILTHPDEDHKSGLIELISSGYPIEYLLLPEIGIEDDAYDELELMAKEAGIEVRYLKRGSTLKEKELTIKCLHPSKEYVPQSRNDYSTILSLHINELDMLFTGDIEAKGEAEVTKYLEEDYDILKVAHHGSKNSTSLEFLEKVKAEYAVISCGKKNRYGHPHQELLERLNEKNMKVFITKESGAITIALKKNKVRLREYLQE